MKIIRAPDVDMMTVSRSSRSQRKSIMNFALPGLSVVDYGRLDEIDNFYQDCQNMRDYYRDPYNKLPRPVSFSKHYGKCGLQHIDKTTNLLMQPSRYVRQHQPIICPMEYGRELNLGEGIRLGGQYYPTSCIKYKR